MGLSDSVQFSKVSADFSCDEHSSTCISSDSMQVGWIMSTIHGGRAPVPIEPRIGAVIVEHHTVFDSFSWSKVSRNLSSTGEIDPKNYGLKTANASTFAVVNDPFQIQGSYISAGSLNVPPSQFSHGRRKGAVDPYQPFQYLQVRVGRCVNTTSFPHCASEEEQWAFFRDKVLDLFVINRCSQSQDLPASKRPNACNAGNRYSIESSFPHSLARYTLDDDAVPMQDAFVGRVLYSVSGATAPRSHVMMGMVFMDNFRFSASPTTQF